MHLHVATTYWVIDVLKFSYNMINTELHVNNVIIVEIVD